jgi:2-hydroxy-4-carboxymuconate semialdehyde hemiacetal dehydrogenase
MITTRPVRIGMLGHGAIGAEHARAFRAAGCELVIVMGPDDRAAELFASKYGFARATDRLDDVIGAGDVDAVVIASPNAAHAMQAIAALNGGKHVLCEVPLGLSLTDVVAVQDAAAGRLVCMVCHTQRFLPPLVRLRRRIQDGQLEPLSLATTMAMYRRENVGWTGRSRTWVDNLLWHHGTHAIDTALWLLDDEPTTVQASSGRPHPQTGAPMDLSVTMTTRTGRLATLALSYNAMTPINDVLLVGESDTVRIRDWQVQSTDGDAAPEPPDGMLTPAVRAQAQSFVRAINGERNAGPTIADVMPTYRTVQLVEDEISRQRSHRAIALERKTFG